MEDEQILALLLAKEEQGLKELEQKYGNKLKHLAMSILPEEDALECVNDTYLAVWNSIPPKQPEYLFAYTAKICRNTALNRVEWSNAAKRNAIVVELSDELLECIPNTSATLETNELPIYSIRFYRLCLSKNGISSFTATGMEHLSKN